MKYLLALIFMASSVNAETGLLITEPVIVQPMTTIFDSAPAHGSLVFSSPDLNTYYFAMDVGSAFRASDYRAKTKIGAVLKAPFVATLQVGKAAIRVPGATISNFKTDPVESSIAVLAVAAAYGSQTGWYGLNKEDDEKDVKGFKTESAPLPHPELGLSLLQTHASRHQCSATGPSTKPVKLTATFGESGSSHCAIEAGEFPAAE